MSAEDIKPDHKGYTCAEPYGLTCVHWKAYAEAKQVEYENSDLEVWMSPTPDSVERTTRWAPALCPDADCVRDGGHAGLHVNIAGQWL